MPDTKLRPLFFFFVFVSFILLVASSRGSGRSRKPSFTHVRQNVDGTLTATIESRMHCDYSNCNLTTELLHTPVSCGVVQLGGRAAGAIIPLIGRLNFFTTTLHSDKDTRAEMVGSAGRQRAADWAGIQAAAKFGHDAQLNTLNAPSFRIRVVSSGAAGRWERRRNLVKIWSQLIPLKFGRGLGGICLHGPSTNRIQLEFVNGYTAQLSHSPHAASKSTITITTIPTSSNCRISGSPSSAPSSP